MKRGVQTQVMTPGAWATLIDARPAVVKLIDPDPNEARRLRDRWAPLLIARVWTDDDQDLSDPDAAAARLFARVLARLGPDHPFDFVETPWNETGQANADELGRLAQASITFMRLANALGWRCILGNFSVGNPQPEDFWAFLPALRAGRKYRAWLGVHEYGLPDHLGVPDWVGRIRLLYDRVPVALRLPVCLTEGGIDGGLEQRARWGWRSYHLSPGAYASWLDQYAQVYAPLPYVKALALFLNGGNNDWTGFDVAGEGAIIRWLQQS